MPSFEAKITSKGQITLPAQVRARMRVDVGDKVVFSETADGGYLVMSKNGLLGDLQGIIKSGPRATGDDIARWINEARESRCPGGLKRRITKQTATP